MNNQSVLLIMSLALPLMTNPMQQNFSYYVNNCYIQVRDQVNQLPTDDDKNIMHARVSDVAEKSVKNNIQLDVNFPQILRDELARLRNSPTELRLLLAKEKFRQSKLRKPGRCINPEVERRAVQAIQEKRAMEARHNAALANIPKYVFPAPAAPEDTSEKGFAKIVGGVPDNIIDLVRMLRGQLDYRRFDLPFPKGILFTGPPGTGKTALARACAEEMGCPFIATTGSAFVEQYVGLGARRVRELFADAREKARTSSYGKTFVFIDEIDAIGSRQRRADDTEVTRTVTQLLAELDGFDQNERVIVAAATNNPAGLDPALTRPGRLGTIINIPLPDLNKRIALLKFYSRKRPLQTDIAWQNIASQLEGANVADVKDITDKAAQIACRERYNYVGQDHFNRALVLYREAEAERRRNHLNP